MRETPETRSRIMRAVKGRDTAPELLVRRLIHRLGYRYVLHRSALPGTPDLTFPSRRKVIFVHGCFWHGHDCPRGARAPHANADYWRRKIANNRARDARSMQALAEGGWLTLILWECELKNTAALISKVRAFLDQPTNIRGAIAPDS